MDADHGCGPMKQGSSKRGGRGRPDRWAFCLALLLGLPFSGCAVSSVEEGSKLERATVDLIKVGMDKKEVLRLLGPPEEFRRPELLDVVFSNSVAPEMLDPSAAIFNDVFSYRYTHGKVKIFTVILFTWMGVDIRSDDLVVFFDEEDRVKYFSYREDTSD